MAAHRPDWIPWPHPPGLMERCWQASDRRTQSFSRTASALAYPTAPSWKPSILRPTASVITVIPQGRNATSAVPVSAPRLRYGWCVRGASVRVTRARGGSAARQSAPTAVPGSRRHRQAEPGRRGRHHRRQGRPASRRRRATATGRTGRRGERGRRARADRHHPSLAAPRPSSALRRYHDSRARTTPMVSRPSPFQSPATGRSPARPKEKAVPLRRGAVHVRQAKGRASLDAR